MNRYKKQVAELDARHHWRVRLLTLLGASTIIAVSLWAANAQFESPDFPRWWQGAKDWWAEDWFPEQEERYAIPPQLPASIAETNGATTASLPLAGTDSSISKVPLPLILVRTEPGRNTKEGKAFIGTAKENPQTYTSGAVLVNGVRIEEVHADHVVLERNGIFATLYLDGSAKSNSGLPELLSVVALPQLETAVADYREVLTDYIRPSAVYEGDAIKGFEVYAGQRAGVFERLGLQDGDLITAINDEKFSSPQQAMQLFYQLTEGMALIATVVRGGKTERANLNGSLVLEDLRLGGPPSASSLGNALPGP